MTELHDALKYLAPTEWEDVPTEDLGAYLSEHFQAAELLVNSVPPPPNGTPFTSSQPQFTTPNSAKSAKEVHPSSARPAPPDKDHEDLQKNWGKPMKYSQKENPLAVALYKMAGHDRHGAWFARHNILEGLGFSKFKNAMMREFPETLLTQGGPGEGAKRGLSADQRVERADVDGVGRMDIYQLSAQMPSPVSPREFLTLLLSTDGGLTEKSAADVQDGDKYVPRHFMVVSRPLEHSDVAHRSAFVRGQYESVELIREIPLHASNTPDEAATDPELNPVEWIMITRSDPAGGVPRFLVDRGTPGAMLGDVTKFLDWACGQEDIPDLDEDTDQQQQTSEQGAEDLDREGMALPTRALSNGDATADTIEKPGGQAFAPAAVGQGLQAGPIHPEESDTRYLSDSSSETSSMDSFLSAEEMKRLSTAPEAPPRESTENLSVESAPSSGGSSKNEKKNLSQHDKEVLKIMQQREKLDQKLAKKRAAEENKMKQSHEKEESEQSKARDKMEKEMKKTEERHRKEIEKLETKRDKESRKAEKRRRKKEDQNKLSLVARERDESRSQADLLRKESELLREQVEGLQRENTALATRLGKVAGPEALRSVQDEIGARMRSGTAKSMRSGDSASLNSGGSGRKNSQEVIS